MTDARHVTCAALCISTQRYSNPASAHGLTMLPVRSHKLRTVPLERSSSQTKRLAHGGMSWWPPAHRLTLSRETPIMCAKGVFHRGPSSATAARMNWPESIVIPCHGKRAIEGNFAVKTVILYHASSMEIPVSGPAARPFMAMTAGITANDDADPIAINDEACSMPAVVSRRKGAYDARI